jgi:hypothetical protein
VPVETSTLAGKTEEVMATSRPRITRLDSWKHAAIATCYGVVGIASVVALISGYFLWNESKLKRSPPWNTAAIIAKYDGVSVSDKDKHISFQYLLENNTDQDYKLEGPTGICLAVKLGREKSLTRCLDNVQQEIRFPTLVPARQRVMFVIATPKICTKEFKWANSPDEPEKQRKEFENYVRNKMPNLDGFALFDDFHRYEIDFPKGW